MKRKTTKELLAESFLELAENKRIDKITITEIAQNCGMSQPTFYNHFKDKYDLIVWIYVSSSNIIMSKIGKDGYQWRDTLFDAARQFLDNRDFVLNALKHTGGKDSFVENLRRINIDLLTAEVRKRLVGETIPDELLGIMRVYVYGTVQMMLEWLLDPSKLTPDQVAVIWEKSLPEELRQYLYP